MSQVSLSTGTAITGVFRFNLNTSRLLQARDRGLASASNRYLAIVRQDARKAIKVKALTKLQRQKQFAGSLERRRKWKQRRRELARVTSSPGKPPYAHQRSDGFGIRFIAYTYDAKKLTGIVGYVKTHSAKGQHVVRALEHGGRSVNWAGKSVNIKARPNILPTARRKWPKFLQFMKGAIK